MATTGSVLHVAPQPWPSRGRSFQNSRTIMETASAPVGGLAEEVDFKVLHAAFLPFGDITDIQIPLDYETAVLLNSREEQGSSVLAVEPWFLFTWKSTEDLSLLSLNWQRVLQLLSTTLSVCLLFRRLWEPNLGLPCGRENESELFGWTIRVNLAKPMRIKEGSSRPVFSDDDWLKKFSGKTLEENKEEEWLQPPKAETQEALLIFPNSTQIPPPRNFSVSSSRVSLFHLEHKARLQSPPLSSEHQVQAGELPSLLPL
ncbi:uncharacterized protein [Dasypus novemcinctus]|uniref:uncharacterized protein n=1 Tax=Dasypus novemcinctus TaxID=9361 RepID=UPI000C837071|nr:uncharacterized protein LOC101444791 [Dasypus novemcinctus]